MNPTAMASRHRAIYIGAIVILVGMVVVGLLAFQQVHKDSKANRKADQLSAKLKDAGYPVPEHSRIVRTLGDDGGSICEDPNSALNRAQRDAASGNGAGGPGSRPVISDRQMAQAFVLVLQVYCPDEVEQYEKDISDMKFSDADSS